MPADYQNLNTTLIHALKKKIEALKEEKERYSELFEQSNDAIFLIDSNRRIFGVNKKAEELTGYTEKELLKMNVPQLCPISELVKFRVLFKQSFEKGVRAESQLLTKGNKIKNVEVCAKGIRLKDGSFVQTIIRDITERKKAEEALKESEEKFKSIFDNASDGILLADIGTKKFAVANKTICNMLGYSEDELKRLSVNDIHPKKDLPYVIGQFEKQAKKEIALAKNIPLKRKDGSVFYADINSMPVKFGGKTYLAGIFRDITERKKAEEELKESEAKYKTIVENATDWIFLLDTKLKFVSLNKAIANLFHKLPNEVIDKSIFDVFPKEIAAGFAKNNHEVIRSGKSKFTEEKMAIGGREFDISTSLNPIKNNSGKVVAVMGITRDITKEKKAENKFKETKEKYEKEINELKRKLKARRQL